VSTHTTRRTCNWNLHPRDAAVYGVDLGKNIFHIVGVDASGAVVQRVKFRRHTLLAFFERAGRALVGMDACPGSQWLARKLQAMGHRVRIIPVQFVKPWAKSQNNDTPDAEAIAEAVTRPTMRFTEVRATEQVDLQALHRIRDQLVSGRTRVINQARAFCLEYGVAIRQGAGVFRRDLPRVLADETNDLTPVMRRMLAKLGEDVARLDARIAQVGRKIEALAARDDRARRPHLDCRAIPAHVDETDDLGRRDKPFGPDAMAPTARESQKNRRSTCWCYSILTTAQGFLGQQIYSATYT